MDLAFWQPLDAEQVGVATFVLVSGVRLGGWPADMPRSSSWPVAGDAGYISTMVLRCGLIRTIAVIYGSSRTQSLLKHPLRAPGVLWIRVQ